MDYSEQIIRIKKKLELLRSNLSSPNPNVVSRYFQKEIYNPLDEYDPLDESIINQFEIKYRIRLPEAYREFMLAMGQPKCSGSKVIIGPFYGLYSGDSLDELCELTKSLTERCNFFPDMSYQDFYSLRKNLGEDAFLQGTGSPDMKDQLFQGSLDIATLGCSDILGIVITGPYRGKLFKVNMEFFEGIDMPIFYPDTNFLAWYERWLDCSLAGVEFK